ncbi:MAG: MMPL family transporter [Actinomycetota bacterium]|nr:MMPL family transporter [Actinomycetota bacterium]
MLGRLGQLAYRRRRLVVLGWLVLLVVGFTVGGAVFSRLNDPGGSSRAESVRGFDLLGQARDTGPRVVAVVDEAAVDDPAVRQAVITAAGQVGRIAGVARVIDVYSAPDPRLRATDGRASLLLVDLAKSLGRSDFDRAVADVKARLHEIPGTTTRVGGGPIANAEINDTVNSDLQRGELVSLPVALVAMVVIFGGLVAAGLPLAAAVVSIAGALLILLGFSAVMDVSPNVVSVVTVLGLGISIDYSLLIVNRFREERARGLDVPAAVGRTAETAGRTITFSALTVMVALSGLFVFDDPTYHSMGAAGVSVVLIGLLAALMLVPALLGMVGRLIKVPARPVPDDGAFARLTRRVQRHPLPVAMAIAAVLVAAGIPFLGAHFGNGGTNLLPASFESRQVTDSVQSRFPGRQADPVVVVARVPAGDQRVGAYAAVLRQRPDVADVSVGDRTGRDFTVLEVTPRGTTQGELAQTLVHQLRSARPSFPTLVTGSAAFLVDFKHAVSSRLPWALGMITLATLVLLFLMTGSVLVPVKALVMNLLSLGASFGALVWVFQQGHLAGPLAFTSNGTIETFVPVLVFVFAFGLSMDYEVFLLSRIKELHDAGYSGADAVAVGLQRSGRIITSAAALIVIVFAGFAAGRMLAIKEMGLALSLAVLLDATLVRCLLVPATMSMLGERNWWAPAPLRRLHDRIGLREAAAAVPPVPAMPGPREAPEPVVPAGRPAADG